MIDRLKLILYVGAVLLITSVHDLRFLAGALVLLLALSGRDLPGIVRRAALAIALFNSVVTVSYTVASLIRGDFSIYYVTLLNLRVFLLTSLTFLFALRVNLVKALAFSSTLSYLLTLAMSQVLTFRRLLLDFRMALESRMIVRSGPRTLYRHAASSVSFFLEKSLDSVTDITQAMKSRGFFGAQG